MKMILKKQSFGMNTEALMKIVLNIAIKFHGQLCLQIKTGIKNILLPMHYAKH